MPLFRWSEDNESDLESNTDNEQFAEEIAYRFAAGFEEEVSHAAPAYQG
jgi:hypothetical protein